MRDLVVTTGPIGSGKSTVAELLGHRFASAGRSVAIADLDDLAFTQRGVLDLAEFWRRAGVAHAALARGWFDSGIEVVIGHGPFSEARSYDALFAAGGAGTRPHHVLLTVTFEVARHRVATDPSRPSSALSKDPVFLRSTFDAFAEQDLPPADHTVDTSELEATDVAEHLFLALVERRGASEAGPGAIDRPG